MNDKKILVIDDDPDIVEAVELVLSSEGFESKSTTKGEETLKHVLEYKPDLIILDLLLSGNDGSKICRNLKANKKAQHIPIIMMSAHPQAKKAALDSGANGFVAKPFSIDELILEVNKLLE